jgi:hypothetical protein
MQLALSHLGYRPGSPKTATLFFQGELVKTESRWGTFWQADFSDFTTPGSYQISAPFMIADCLKEGRNG